MVFNHSDFIAKESTHMSLNRETRMTYLGHSTLLIETPGGKRLLIDPWTTGNPACPERFKDPAALGKLDAVLVTHLHSDHAGDAPAVLKAHPEAVLVSIFEVGNYLKSKGAQNLSPMNTGGTQTVAGIEVTMTQAIHSSSLEENGQIVYGGEPVGYVLKLENGFTLYAAGDTALFGDMALIRELYQPELAFLPIGDHFTMGPREAAYATQRLGVSHVVPIHYATFPLLTGTPEKLSAELQSRSLGHVQVHALKPGETLD